MRIGVVSDTHGHLESTRRAVRMLESLEVETVLHCGDIGAPEIVPLLAPWPTHFVFGNVDYDHRRLSQAIDQAGQTCHGRCGRFELAGTRIALLHGDDQRQFGQIVDEREVDLVCFGHTHVAEMRHCGEMLLLNPGALYRAHPHSIAIVELPQCEAHHVTV